MVSLKGSSSRPNASKLLVVDDVPDNLVLMQAILEDEESYETSYADSGKAALEQIAASVPDLVLLDIMMPDMNGYEVTRRIRQNPSLSHIPILLVTAHDDIRASEGQRVGANGFIRKPFDIQDLLTTVQDTLKGRVANQREYATCA